MLQSPPLEAHTVLVVPHKPTDLQVLLTGIPHPSVFASLSDCLGSHIHWHSSQSGSALIPSVMFRPLPQSWIITMNSFKNRQQGPTNHHKLFWHASSALTRHLGKFPGGHASLDYSLANTLNCGVLKIGSQKKKGSLLVI